MRFRRVSILSVAVIFCVSGMLSKGAAETDRTAGVRGAKTAAVDVTLDGNDWRMGSFAFGEGEKAGAEDVQFNDSGFKAVTVPGDTQIQAGFTGVDRWFDSKGLIAVNQKEWWYRKHFQAGRKIPGTVTRLVFDGADYFATVWLNGELLGKHEGTYVSFSFDVTDKLHYGGDNLLVVQLTHPWEPKGRGLLEYMNGDFTMAIPGSAAVLKKQPFFIDMDWDALPAQGNAAYDMGIWRSVHLRTTSPVTIEDLNVRTESIGADGMATLHIGMTLQNAGTETVTKTVALRMKPDNFEGAARELPPLTVTAAPGATSAAPASASPSAAPSSSNTRDASGRKAPPARAAASSSPCPVQERSRPFVRPLPRDRCTQVSWHRRAP